METTGKPIKTTKKARQKTLLEMIEEYGYVCGVVDVITARCSDERPSLSKRQEQIEKYSKKKKALLAEIKRELKRAKAGILSPELYGA